MFKEPNTLLLPYCPLQEKYEELTWQISTEKKKNL